jgi:hypothetical protein
MGRCVFLSALIAGMVVMASSGMAGNMVATCPVLSDSGVPGDVTASRLEVKYRVKTGLATIVDGVDYVHVDPATGNETREGFVGMGRMAGLSVVYCNPNEAELLESQQAFSFWSNCLPGVAGLQEINLLGTLSMREPGKLDFDLVAPDFTIQRRLVQTDICR